MLQFLVEKHFFRKQALVFSAEEKEVQAVSRNASTTDYRRGSNRQKQQKHSQSILQIATPANGRRYC